MKKILGWGIISVTIVLAVCMWVDIIIKNGWMVMVPLLCIFVVAFILLRIVIWCFTEK